mgnify:CR=1 FL=1
MLLADFGAEVIKIEEPGRGDYARSFPPFLKDFGYWHLQLNRNKKSVVLNLKSDAGRRAFLELVKTADVVVESYRPGVLEKLGIDYAAAKDGESANYLLLADRLRQKGTAGQAGRP